MNNSNDRNSKQRGGNNSGYGGKKPGHGRNNLGHGGNNWNKNKGSNTNRKNNQRSKGGERNFQKFVDTEHMNYESNYWPNNNWNYDNSRTNDYQINEPRNGGGIHPWIRNQPANHLIIPQHINFDEQQERTHQDIVPNNIDSVHKKQPESNVTKQEAIRVINREICVPKNTNNTEVTQSSSEVHQPSASPITSNTSVKIKQEKDLLIRLKQEKKSSSSSSSSSETSSSEDEPQHNRKATVTVKPEITSIVRSPSLPLNIKLKPRTSSISSKTEKHNPVVENSSSSSSSSSDEEPPPPPSTPKAEKIGKPQTSKKSGSMNQKINSEDDVVCVGNLENKIILEDESENSSSTDEESRNEITSAKALNEPSKKSSEKCMICDKKGHTSFQCQMICKNCSAPYHGYRTCPHPANLNTMMQLFIEFCMQQLQNFQVEKQNNASDVNNVPKPKVDSSHLTNVANKCNKLKRKQVMANETNKKRKKSKKRKVSASKKTKSKANNEESSDDSSEDGSDTEASDTETDKQISDSSAESLVFSKRKRKLKIATGSKPLSNFSANSVGLPIVLNGFPQLTVPTSSIQNQNPSTNALNTLLLTQMFQNAIGSLKQ